MSDLAPLEKRIRGAVLAALAMLVVVAPLVGVYGLSPFVFAYALQPYELAVAVSVMFAEAAAIAALAFLVLRARR